MSTLYNMTEQAKYLYSLLENGDIEEQVLIDTIESIGANEKLESYVYIQKQFEADIEAYKKEKIRLENKIKTCQNAILKMKSAMLDFMICSGLNKIKAGTFNLFLRDFESINIADPKKIPPEYITPSDPKIDKEGIKKAIKNGTPIPGAELVKNKSIIAK